MKANRMKRKLLSVALVALTSLMVSCGYSKDIKEYPEPWQTLDPGQPRPRFPTPRIITEGGGGRVEPGDLVQVNVQTKFGLPEPKWQSDGDWWIWIGFRTREETAFFSTEPRTTSALVGQREGTVLDFVDGKDGSGKEEKYAGVLKAIPFGDDRYYEWRKPGSPPYADVDIYVSTYKNPSKIEIKRVCKGPLQYRTVRLFDDSPVEVCSGLKCYTSNKPSEAWVDEARLEATCSDGKVAIFQYGPIDSRSGRAGRSPVMGYFDDWLYQSWKKVPLGVQFKGNRSPVVTVTNQQLLATRSDTPLQIDLSDWIRDPDGDRLTVRFLEQPVRGNLLPNSDGTFTYTPNSGASGVELLSYKVSDGLVESENMGRILINVWKPAE